MKKKDIRDLSIEELEEFFVRHKIKKFRVNQLNNWIWKKGSASFNVMTSLSKNIRNLLNEHFTINTISIDKKLKSIDGTIKYSFINIWDLNSSLKSAFNKINIFCVSLKLFG